MVTEVKKAVKLTAQTLDEAKTMKSQHMQAIVNLEAEIAKIDKVTDLDKFLAKNKELLQLYTEMPKFAKLVNSFETKSADELQAAVEKARIEKENTELGTIRAGVTDKIRQLGDIMVSPIDTMSRELRDTITGLVFQVSQDYATAKASGFYYRKVVSKNEQGVETTSLEVGLDTPKVKAAKERRTPGSGSGGVRGGAAVCKELGIPHNSEVGGPSFRVSVKAYLAANPSEKDRVVKAFTDKGITL